MDDEPIKIVLSNCGGKLAVCSVGYRSAATYTFISREAPLLAHEIEQARALWLQTKRVTGLEPKVAEIGKQFPQIRKLCTPYDVLTYVKPGGSGDRWGLTSIAATNEIMQELFPTLTPEYIERSGRKRSKPKKDSKPL